VDVPRADIDACVASHQRLLGWVADLDDDGARAASRLPGWSRGHVITHLARNADSVVRRLTGAREGQVADQYEGGAAGRAAEIEAGASRSAADLLADLRTACAGVDVALAAHPEDRWDGLSRGVDGDEAPVARLPFGRWREVEVHLVDLDVGYEPSDWPAALVHRWLPELLPALAGRCEPAPLLAWILRRGAAPLLDPW